MRTVTIGVSSIEETSARALAAFRGEMQGAFISFPTVEGLWTVLTPRRWALLQALAGREPMSLRAVARLLDRDVKNTHADVHALLNAGILDRTDDARIVFPYDSVHVDFTIGKAA
ncbi:helix-turn-helix domain-containing protein [Methylobacterium sp. E-005]|uniref:HVO_A0114 family putative DNA-binding protein n=1 Tax=Methylobacterium sp. E-005 TaxID=2836549 RepID=UPI001FB9E7AB|nr:helix-turn-helix domain-containing protein [Methylobacterium sp. E-005]MCJ2089974.1 helix-turn-helix domain-containing protein [Methylobacterium sp. E-005]